MSTAHENPPTDKSTGAPSKLQAPLVVHAYVWIFMITLSVSPVLFLLGTRDRLDSLDWAAALTAVLLLQVALWIAQRRCSRDDLTYWEGLLVVAASMSTGVPTISFILAFPLMLTTVLSSFLFVLTHDEKNPGHHASIRFARLIISAHKRRL